MGNQEGRLETPLMGAGSFLQDTTGLRPGMQSLAQKFRSKGLRYRGLHQEELQQDLAVVNEMVATMKLLHSRLHDQPQWKVMVLLSDLESSCSAIGGLTEEMFLIFAAAVDEVFQAPTNEQVERFSDELRALRKEEFGTDPLRLSWWGAVFRFPKRLPSAVSQEQHAMMKEEQDAMLQHVLARLTDITGKNPVLLQWFGIALKKSAMNGQYGFLDSEWLARLHQLSSKKVTWRWCAMGVMAQHMVEEDVIREAEFANQKLQVIEAISTLKTILVPVMINELQALATHLNGQSALLQEGKTRFVAAVATGTLGLLNALLPRLWTLYSDKQD